MDIPPQTPPRKRSSGLVVPHAPTRLQRTAAWIAFAAERLLTMTLRLEWEVGGLETWRDRSHPRIFCIWHNRLALSMLLYRRQTAIQSKVGRLAALVSASKDGAFLAAILERFNVRPIRGSSSRRGPQALLELINAADSGLDIAITPDGPRGPKYFVHEGIIAAAQVTGSPIIPVSYSCSWRITLRSWDAFQIPLPFARCRIRLGTPILVPRDLDKSRMTELRQELQQAMMRITQD